MADSPSQGPSYEDFVEAFLSGDLRHPDDLLTAYQAFMGLFYSGIPLDLDQSVEDFLKAGFRLAQMDFASQNKPVPKSVNLAHTMIGGGAKVRKGPPPPPSSRTPRRVELRPFPSVQPVEEVVISDEDESDNQQPVPSPQPGPSHTADNNERRVASKSFKRREAELNEESSGTASEPSDEQRIEILQTRQRFLKKFQTTFREESFQIKGIKNDIPLAANLESLFNTILQRQIEALGAQGHDRCFIELESSDNPDRNIWLGLRRVDQLSSQVLLQKLERTVQSNQEFLISGQLSVRFIHIPTPKPAGFNDNQPGESVNSWVDRRLKQKLIYSPQNQNDNMCLIRATIIGSVKHFIPKREFLKMKKPESYIQTGLSRQLCACAGLNPNTRNELDAVQKVQDALPDFRVVVFSDIKGKDIIFHGPKSTPERPRRNVYLFWHDGHVYTILKVKRVFGWSYFCETCLKGFHHFNEHRCPGACWRCGGPALHTVPDGKRLLKCNKCNRNFATEECFRFHESEKVYDNKKKSTCDLRKICSKCNRPYKLDVRGKRKMQAHVCNQYMCRNCKKMVDENHFCYMQPWKEEEINAKTDYLTVYFDCETTQHEPLENKENWKLHRVNYLVSQVVCKHCSTNKDSDHHCANCGERTKIFHSLDDLQKNPISEFLDYLEQLCSVRKRYITLFSHNGSSFDNFLIISELIARNKIPSIISKGLKILSMKVDGMCFKDSLLFLNTKLSKLPTLFNIEGIRKGLFPYLCNNPNFYNYVGKLPNKEMYAISTMSKKDADSFHQWYDAKVQEKYVFNFREELKAYTIDDVNILRLSCEKFREDFIQEAGFDCLFYNLTLSSACMCIYRRNFLPTNSIGMYPPLGYRNGDKQSYKALQWLSYEQQRLGEDPIIRTSHNGRECKVMGIKVDGFCSSQGENIIYSFLGCYWHGHNCRKFRNPRAALPHTVEKDRETRYEATLRIHDNFKDSGYTVKMKWECEFDRECKQNEEIKRFFQTHPMKRVPPFDVRDCYFGGRTNCIKTYYKANIKKGEKILYFDIQSLYPFCLMTKKYPKGHPKVYLGNDPRRPDISHMEGIIHCEILPPRNLYIPVLPVKAPNGRLMFSLCRTCTEALHSGPCLHRTSAERALRGVWGAPELRLALSKGYQIIKIIEIWHYEETSEYNARSGVDSLFSGYIKSFMRKKIESSGWPAECIDDDTKRRFIQENEDRLGIKIDPNNMKRNEALRYLYKLFLNSFYGKFGERTDRTQVFFVHSFTEFMDFIQDESKEIQSLMPVSDNMLQLAMKPTAESEECLPSNSVIHAAYTTMHGRMVLYEYLDLLKERCLYFDTDSVIFISKPGYPDPKKGDYLGEMSDELESFGPGSFCYEFVSGGPKNYALKIACGGQIENTKTIIKVRGITINQSCTDIVTFDNLRDMVINGKEPHNIRISSQIARLRGWKIVTRPTSKVWQPVITKRRRLQNKRDTLPVGYVGPLEEDEENDHDLEEDEELLQELEELYND